ncbi:hypothetical protein HYT51_02430 [Candidatus Woesearchaeota archaeon]|nr:hypothetical protein [Candidatus Woesearchaeota archaeon]
MKRVPHCDYWDKCKNKAYQEVYQEVSIKIEVGATFVENISTKNEKDLKENFLIVW